MIMKGKGLLVGLRLAKIDETYTSWDLLNPMMSPTSDQDWISPNCINTKTKQSSHENKEKYQFGDF